MTQSAPTRNRFPLLMIHQQIKRIKNRLIKLTHEIHNQVVEREGTHALKASQRQSMPI